MNNKLLLLGMGLFVTTCFSCKKFIDKQKENYVIGIMTDGQWYLENYTESGADHTADFAEYAFQFYENKKLDAISSAGAAVNTGTWSADVNNLAMTVNFPSPGEKLKRLNYAWKITDSYTTLVYAETNTAAGLITIRLRKK